MAVVIDGATGRLVSRTPLPRESQVFEARLDGQQIGSVACRSRWYHNTPDTVGPVVGDDGRGYLLVRRADLRAVGSCVMSDPSTDVEGAVGVDLLALSPSGVVSVLPLQDLMCPLAPLNSNTMCDVAPLVQQLVPDGLGGILARWRLTTGLEPAFPHNSIRQTMVTRVVGEARIDWPVDATTAILMTGDGTAYLRGASGGVEARDVTTWAARWSAIAPGTPLMALDGGGMVVLDSEVVSFLNEEGQIVAGETIPLVNPLSFLQQGEWLGSLAGGMSALASIVAGPYPVKARAFFTAMTATRGNPAGQAQPTVGCVPPPFLVAPHPKSLPAGATVTYKFDLSTGWTAERMIEVIAAFDLWTTANQQSELNTTFEMVTEGPAMIMLRNAELSVLRFGLTEPTSDPVSGAISSATITFNDSPAGLLTASSAYRAAALHEIGHLLGLDDNTIEIPGEILPWSTGPAGGTVMNYFSGPNDPKGYTSKVVTACDRDQAKAAAFRPWP